jgi:hypothetical protein
VVSGVAIGARRFRAVIVPGSSRIEPQHRSCIPGDHIVPDQIV